MIENMAETPQLKRERMLERANEIKRKTEDARLKFVDECYERRFREECDEMNAHKGQSLLLACSQQQRRQMEEKDLLARLDDEREEKYARLWEEDMRRKEFAERAKLDKAARARQDSIDGVAAQMVEVNARKEEEKQRAEAEQQMRLDWEKAKDQDDSERRERERQRLEKRYERAQEGRIGRRKIVRKGIHRDGSRQGRIGESKGGRQTGGQPSGYSRLHGLSELAATRERGTRSTAGQTARGAT
eukprot:600925_1